jgi:TPR repeat protein
MNTPPAATGNTLDRGIAFHQRGAFVQAYICLLPLAEAGDGDAQCLVGAMLAQELGGLPKNPVNAVKWLDIGIRSPDRAYVDGMQEIYAELMQKLDWRVIGKGRYRAFRWQQEHLNAEDGEPPEASPDRLAGLESMSAEAAMILGSALNIGEGGPLDYEKAFLCFRHAARLGYPAAAYNVGLSYYIGKGVLGDAHLAIQWLIRAADLGYARAALVLGAMTARGHGVPPDREAALAHLARATQLGDPDAALMAEAIAQGSPMT